MEPIYLDHNATTPTRPEVVEAMARCHARHYANPASRHRPGQQARRALDDAREKIAEILGADLSPPRRDRLILTSGGTEANNLAVLGIALSNMSIPPMGEEQGVRISPLPVGEGQGGRASPPSRIVISAGEHQSVIESAEHLLEQGWRMDTLGLTPQGVVRVEQLPPLLAADTRLVSVLLGNHETGVIQPVEQLAAVCNHARVPMHTDAVQAVGKVPVNFHALGVAAMSIAAHKFRGPPGVGALIVRKDVRIAPLMFGGHHQSGLRPGTEPVPLAVGMAKALELWHKEQQRYAQLLSALRDRFEQQLRAGLQNALGRQLHCRLGGGSATATPTSVVVHGLRAERLPQTSSVAFPGLDGETLLMALDVAGVACSIGAACSSNATELSPTLRAMDLPKELVASSLRFSFGATNTETEIDEAVRRIVGVCRELGGAGNHAPGVI